MLRHLRGYRIRFPGLFSIIKQQSFTPLLRSTFVPPYIPVPEVGGIPFRYALRRAQKLRIETAGQIVLNVRVRSTFAFRALVIIITHPSISLQTSGNVVL